MERPKMGEAWPGVYFRPAASAKGDGVFSERRFAAGELVLVGASIYSVEQNDSHAVQTGPNEFGYEAGIGTMVNHSCDPNCGVRPTELGVFDLVARREISDDEEITVDYAMRNYVVEYFPQECLCGSAICRGLVTGWRDLPEERRAVYEGSIAPFLLKIDREVLCEGALPSGGHCHARRGYHTNPLASRMTQAADGIPPRTTVPHFSRHVSSGRPR
jgi:hypothetical protein